VQKSGVEGRDKEMWECNCLHGNWLMSEIRNIGIKAKLIIPAKILENILYKWRYKLLKVLTTFGNVTKTMMNLRKAFNSIKVLLFCVGVKLGCSH
jgi:hypothetical protein